MSLSDQAKNVIVNHLTQSREPTEYLQEGGLEFLLGPARNFP